MVAVAVIAIFLSPAVIGPGPEESNPWDWVIVMTVTNIPPIVILPFLFGLNRARLLLTIAASAGIFVAQFLMRVPPNLHAVVGYLAVTGMARLARDNRDLSSAIIAVTCGLLVGLACGYNPCTPIEIILAPFTGIMVRIGLRFSRKGHPASQAVTPAVIGETCRI